MIAGNKYTDALTELNEERLVNLCGENKYFEAERLYFLGILSNADSSLQLENSIDYFRKAYDIVKELDITEVTWKILFMITTYYAERGNFGKIEESIVYAKAILDFLAEKLSDPRLKMVFLDQPERHYALETLNRIAEQL